ncbi:MbtH family protein [Streptomyces sp. YS415]|uniref:MbtH family protein n=1 Tax=Streptomyces sp. YS415 TaxID=2944806 RepID=UPI002021D869|nr:MbtH family protein [Streptomyces sp. YS415]MCL7430173.1 MbtH family protein [Streptomyces sp. YS415]
MAGPFEDPDVSYFVVTNDEGEHTLWPVFVDVPKGWRVVFGKSGRTNCLQFIENVWADSGRRT